MQEKETARALLDKGRAAEAKGDLKSAIESFSAAHRIMGVPTTGIYLAKALAKSNRLIEARDIALASSRAPRLPGERPERAIARDDSARLVSELGPRIPFLAISPSPKDAAGLVVLVDGKQLPAAVYGLPWAVDPGEHVVTVRATGYVEQTRKLTVPERRTEAMAFTLVTLVARPIAAPPPPSPQATAEGLSPSWVVAISCFSVAGAAFVAGGVTGGLSLARTSDIQAECDGTRCPSSLRDESEAAQALATVSNVTLAVGGALAIGGAIAMGLGLAGDAETGSVSLRLGPSYWGLEGRF